MSLPESIRSGMHIFFGLLLVSMVISACVAVIRVIVVGLSSINPQLAVAIVAGCATVAVSVLTIVLGKIYESRMAIRKEHREKKIPVYEDLIAFMFRIVMGKKLGNEPTEKEMIEFMAQFTQRVMIWGSDDVIMAWGDFRDSSLAAQNNPTLVLFKYESLLLIIRRDLGHTNKNIGQGKLLRLFVNDLDKHLLPVPGKIEK